MPYPSLQPVIALGKHLLHPLQYFGQRLPVFRLDVKRNPVVVKAEPPDLKGEAEHGFTKHFGKKGGGLGLAEDGLAVVDTGAHFVPNVLGKLT
jgi:hypothetical protein